MPIRRLAGRDCTAALHSEVGSSSVLKNVLVSQSIVLLRCDFDSLFHVLFRGRVVLEFGKGL